VISTQIPGGKTPPSRKKRKRWYEEFPSRVLGLLQCSFNLPGGTSCPDQLFGPEHSQGGL